MKFKTVNIPFLDLIAFVNVPNLSCLIIKKSFKIFRPNAEHPKKKDNGSESHKLNLLRCLLFYKKNSAFSADNSHQIKL